MVSEIQIHKTAKLNIGPYFRENVPQISIPFPFSAGSQLTFGATNMAGGAANPNMSPSNPVVVWETGAAAAPPTSPPS